MALSTAQTITNASEVLKVFYLPAIQESMNHDTPLADILENNYEDVSGSTAKIETHIGRSTGRGARNDIEALPTANRQKYQTMNVPMKYYYGRITVSGPTIAATRDERGSYIRALDAEISGIVDDAKKEKNRQMWGCGAGIVGRWNSGTSTSIVLQKAYTGANCSGTNNLGAFGSTLGAKYFKDGFVDGSAVVISGMSSAATKEFTVDATDISVSAVAESTGYDTITCTDASVSEAAGTFYVRPLGLGTPGSTASPIRKEMMGLRGIVDNIDLDEIYMRDGTNADGGGSVVADTLQGLAVGSYPHWKAVVSTHPSGRYAAQRSLSFMLMQKVFDAVERNVGMEDGMSGPNVMFTTRAIRREYFDLCASDRRYINTIDFDGGGNWKGLEYNGIPILVDNDAIDGEIYFLTTQHLSKYRMSDWSWMQKDGAVLSRISGYDAYEAILYIYEELGCKRRNSQGVLCDIAYEDELS